MKDKYITCDIFSINHFYKEGYEIVSIYDETFISYEDSFGTFMGNPVNIKIPVQKTITKVLMTLSKSAEVLYGEKRNENNS